MPWETWAILFDGCPSAQRCNILLSTGKIGYRRKPSVRLPASITDIFKPRKICIYEQPQNGDNNDTQQRQSVVPRVTKVSPVQPGSSHPEPTSRLPAHPSTTITTHVLVPPTLFSNLTVCVMTRAPAWNGCEQGPSLFPSECRGMTDDYLSYPTNPHDNSNLETRVNSPPTTTTTITITCLLVFSRLDMEQATHSIT